LGISVTYVEENCRPVGLRSPASDEPVLDTVLQESYLHAELIYDPPLSLIDVSISNYRDDEDFLDHDYVLHFYARNPIAHREAMPIEVSLWNMYFWQSREELAKILRLSLSGKLPKDMRLGDVRLDTSTGELYAELWVPLGDNLTFGQLEERSRTLDDAFSKIWQRVSVVSKGVLQPPAHAEDPHFPTVFLCHSTMDKPFVRQLRDELRKRKIRVWLDEEQILVGHDFVQRMQEGISNSDFTVVVLSPRFVKFGPWAKEEYRAALVKQVSENKIVLLPILQETCEIPSLLSTKKYADFRNSFEDGLEALAHSILKHK
jgi:hypothetical protein